MSNTKRWPPPKLTAIDFARASGAVDATKLFNHWYAEHIESLGAGVEVFGDPEEVHGIWDVRFKNQTLDTHRAILIGIEPLKEEPSAEELLEDLVRASYDYGPELEKARAYLAKRK